MPRLLSIGLLVVALVAGCSSSESGPEDYVDEANAACRTGLEQRREMIRYTRKTGAGGEGPHRREVALHYVGLGRQLVQGLRNELSDLEPPDASRRAHRLLLSATEEQLAMLDATAAAAEHSDMVDTRPLARLFERLDERQLGAVGLGDCETLYGGPQGVMGTVCVTVDYGAGPIQDCGSRK